MMKRFVLALISVIGAGICGCNIDLAVDSDAAKCIKVGGIWDNKVCKKNPADSRFDNEHGYICKNPGSLVARENNGLITIGECQALCNNDGVCDPCQSCKEITEDGERRFKVSYCYDDKKFKICSPLGCNDDNTDCKETEVNSFCEKIEGISFLCTKENCIKCDSCINDQCKDCNKNEKRCNNSLIETCMNGVWVLDSNNICGLGERCYLNNNEALCEQVCNPNETRCKDNNYYEKCDEEGNWEQGEKCPNGQICKDGACVEDSGNGETSDKNQCKVEGENVTLKNGDTICINNENDIGVIHKCNDGNPTQSACEFSCKCDSKDKCVGDGDTCGDCKNNDVRCNSDSSNLEFCNDGKWEEVGPWGIVTQCVNDFVYYCTEDGKRESAKCADSCNWEGSNSKCSECDPGKHAENCTSGKCNNENVNDWNFGTCVEDSGNGETSDTNQCEVTVEGKDITLENGNPICINNEDGIGVIHECNDGNPTQSACEFSCKCDSKDKCDGDGDTCGDCKNGEKQCSNYNTSDGNILQICKDGKWQKDDTCNNECYKDECVDIDNQSCSEEENGNLRCVNVMGSGSILYVCNNKSWNDLYSCNNGICNAEYTNCEGDSKVCKDGYKKCLTNNQYIECENGVWKNELKNLREYEQCQNGIYVNLKENKENCEKSGGDFSSGECICKTLESNDSLFSNCKENDCKSSECTPIDGNNKKELCFNNNLYVYCNDEWINELMYPSPRELICYNENNIIKINEAVIRALINTMPDNCFPPYNITMGDCSLVYNNNMEFEYHSVDKCAGNHQNYQIKVTDGNEQCTVTNSNQNFKIKTTECIYDTNGVSSATFIAYR